jgi:hypothetical protein
MEKRLLAAGATFITGATPAQVEWRTIRYVQGIVESLGDVHRWPIYDEPLLAKVTGIMERRAVQVARKARTTARVEAVAAAVDDGEPF